MSGSSDQCRAAGAELERAAVTVAQVAMLLSQRRAQDSTWTGVAASCWTVLAAAQADMGREVAQRLVAAARALRRHAEDLAELQARAVRLTQEAAEAGLVLSPDGDIAPVVVPVLPVDPCPTPDQLAHRQALLRAEQAREDLLRRVAGLQREEEWAHDQLCRWLSALDLTWTVLMRGAPPGPGDVGPRSHGGPSQADVVPFGIGAASEVARRVPGEWMPTVLRSAAAGPALGAGYGVWIDTTVNGKGVPEAVVKNVVTAGAGAGAGAGVVYVLTGAGASTGPVGVVVVGTGVVVGGGVAWAVGKLWDQIAKVFAGPPPGIGPRAPGPVRIAVTPHAGVPRPAAVPRPSPGPTPRPVLSRAVRVPSAPRQIGPSTRLSTAPPLLHRTPAATAAPGRVAARSD